ncbi:MAG: hypothetical protein GX643_00605 [Acidimicrobiales bacterium]|nr:hypothetical protein [Acidimicrobiales bacterium]
MTDDRSITLPAPATTLGAAEPAPRRLVRPTFTLPAVVAAVFLVAGAVQLTRAWYPYGDWAVAELVIRHIDRYLPLSGPYSAQRGYDHPLPLVYAIQWIPYHLFGQRSSAGLATTIWWNGAMLASLVWLTARVRAPWLGLTALASVAVVAAQVPAASLILPWNPSLALLPGLLLVFVAWRVSTGSRRLLPVMAGLAVWCTGAHLGFAPMALALSAAGSAGLLVTTVRRGGRQALTTLVRPAAVAAATALLLASPMLVDLVRNGSASNPVHIVERGRPDPDATALPGSELLKILRSELALPPAWASSTPPYDEFYLVRDPRFPAALALGAVAAWTAWRRRAVDELAGMAIGLVGVVASVAGLANIEAGTMQPWYLLSAHATSIAFTSFVFWSTGRSLLHEVRSRNESRANPPVSPHLDPVVGRFAAPAVALVAALAVVPSLQLQPHAADIDGPTLSLADAVVERFEPGDPLRVVGPIGVDGYVTQSLVLQLDRAGLDVRVPDGHLYLFSPAMGAPDGWNGTTLVVQLAEGAAVAPDESASLIAESPITHPIFSTADTVSVWELAPGY